MYCGECQWRVTFPRRNEQKRVRGRREGGGGSEEISLSTVCVMPARRGGGGSDNGSTSQRSHFARCTRFRWSLMRNQRLDAFPITSDFHPSPRSFRTFFSLLLLHCHFEPPTHLRTPLIDHFFLPLSPHPCYVWVFSSKISIIRRTKNKGPNSHMCINLKNKYYFSYV